MQVVKITSVLFIYSVGVPLDNNDFPSNTHLGMRNIFAHEDELCFTMYFFRMTSYSSEIN